jgi:hypothetical protein
MIVIRLLVCALASMLAAGCTVQPIDLIPATELALIERERVDDTGSSAKISVQTLLARARGDLDFDAEMPPTPTMPTGMATQALGDPVMASPGGTRAISIDELLGRAPAPIPEPLSAPPTGQAPVMARESKPEPPLPMVPPASNVPEQNEAQGPIGVDELLARVRAIDAAQRGNAKAQGR